MKFQPLLSLAILLPTLHAFPLHPPEQNHPVLPRSTSLPTSTTTSADPTVTPRGNIGIHESPTFEDHRGPSPSYKQPPHRGLSPSYKQPPRGRTGEDGELAREAKEQKQGSKTVTSVEPTMPAVVKRQEVPKSFPAASPGVLAKAAEDKVPAVGKGSEREVEKGE
ncbi:hypothetical protein ABW19_dt0200501 [Dactylella cylindrospora]|nr:hypothetical protein ABW19_dt0200501 [Dactylella cylindrospora]